MIRDRIMGSCRDVSELLSRSMDERLGPLERLRLKLHFRVCTYCHQFEHQLRRLREAGRQYDEACERPEAPGGLPADARRRIRQALESRASSADDRAENG